MRQALRSHKSYIYTIQLEESMVWILYAAKLNGDTPATRSHITTNAVRFIINYKYKQARTQ